MTPVAMDASKGFMAAPCHGGEAGVIDVGAGDGDAADADAFTVKLEILRVAVAILDLENFGSKGEEVESFGRLGRKGRGFGVVDLRCESERDLRQGRELLKDREEDVRANDAILGFGVREGDGFHSSLLFCTLYSGSEGKGSGSFER
ncbi:hypothetical protein OIU85_014649 [Salix viminalis]|uniref:Uncharacterized protein n=1 Tax=Salix viminalis TaxID=40686 RepID=A0A9Q0NJK7_SALVM|nr:hypothetical protein OIU85_014649 [Salix viminalis]